MKDKYLTVEEMRSITKDALDRKVAEKLEKVINLKAFKEIMEEMEKAALNGKTSISVSANDYDTLHAIVDENKLIKDSDTSFDKEHEDIFDVLENQLGYSLQRLSIKCLITKKNDPAYTQEASIQTCNIYW